MKLIKILDKISKELNRNLVNEQKALLISDGSVTSLLEAFTGKTPEIAGIEQYSIKADENIAKEFKIEENSDILVREVALKINNEIVIYASSLSPLKKLVELKIDKDFINKDKPIGKILRTNKIEYRREILKISIPEDNKFKKFFNNAIMREYFIIHKNEPLIKIKEYLNLDYKFN